MTLVLANWLAVMAALGQDQALGPFARGGAVFVWSLDGRVLLAANPAADRVIANHHAARNQSLRDRNGYGESCRERLRLLGQGLAPATGVRLERLKLGAGPDMVTATCACRRVRLSTGEEGIVVIVRGLDELNQEHDAPVLAAEDESCDETIHALPDRDGLIEAVAADGAEPPTILAAPSAGPLRKPLPGGYSLSGFSSVMNLISSGSQLRFTPQSGHVSQAQVSQARIRPVPPTDMPSAETDTGSTEALVSSQDMQASPAEVSTQPVSLRSLRRVLWESDSEDRITAISPDLVAILDLPSPHELLGHRWIDLINVRIKDLGEGFISAISARKTFSNHRLLFRVGETGRAFIIDMSGSPVLGANHAFAGFRGFGLPRFNEEAVPSGSAGMASAALAPDIADDGPLPGDASVAGQISLPEHAPERLSAAEASPAVTEILAEPAALDVSPAIEIPAIKAETAIKAELSKVERNAFRQIAKALGANVDAEPAPAASSLTDVAGNAEALPLPGPADVEHVDESISREIDPVAEIMAADPAEQRVDSVDAEPDTAGIEPDPADDDSDSISDLEMIDGVQSGGLPVLHAPEGLEVSGVHPVPAAAVDAVAEAPSIVVPLHPQVPPAAKPDTVEVARRAAPPTLVPASGDGFAELLDKLPIGVMVNRGGEAIYANRTFLDLLGYVSLDQIEQMGGLDRLFRGPAPHEGGGAVNLMAQDGDIETVEARLSSINWRGKAATLMAFRRALDPDAPAKLQAAELDIAKRDKRLSELAAILDTATDGVVTVDDQGRILSLNSTAEALFGYDQREVTGEPISILFAPDSHNLAMDYLEGLKGGGVASVLNDGREVLGRVRQGGQVPLFMTMGRIADGAERKFCAVLRDITAWKLAERELTEARKAAERASAQKSDVLAKISHEIRTPLNAIIGFSEVMAEERFGPIGNERYKEYSRDIRESGGYLISLVNDLLDLAKIEAGRLDLEFVSVNLNDIATSAVALLQPEAARNRVVLRSGLSPKLPPVVADERSLRQIVINLLSNAVKFTDAGGQVIVSTALGDKGEAILRVRDTGIGMTEKELALALEPFRQVSTTNRGGGTGLGLPLTKALVEANRGSFVITSIKAEGTLAEVIFPPQRVLAS
jgi:PAS domain S-box-containing protein